MKPGAFPVAGALRAASRLKRKTAGKTPSRFLGKAATAQFQNVWIWPGPKNSPAKLLQPSRALTAPQVGRLEVVILLDPPVVWRLSAGGGLAPRVLATLNLWRVLCKYPRGLVKNTMVRKLLLME